MKVLPFLCCLCFLRSEAFNTRLNNAVSPKPNSLSPPQQRQRSLTMATTLEPQTGMDRAQKLKDLTFLKEVKNDMLTAELALQVDMGQGKKKGSINYEGLAGKLEKDLIILERRTNTINRLYESEKVVEELVSQLTEYQQGLEKVIEKEETKAKDSSQSKKKSKKESSGQDSSNKGLPNPLQLFVRDDGTVDIELLVESGKEAAVKGNELWNRINGRQPGEEGEVRKLAKIPDSPKVVELENYVKEFKDELVEALKNENGLALTYRTLKREGGIVTKEMRGNLRAAEDTTVELKRMIKILELDVELERILPYIEQEIEQSLSMSTDQKLTVAQYALIDNQLKNLLPAARKRDTDFLLEVVDDSELKVLNEDLEDIKTRLGLDLLEQGIKPINIKVDAVSIQSYINKSYGKVKEGISFYSEGTKILSSDVSYAFGLVARAAQGYTLSPREVRSVRRTGKDCLTFIPFVVILIIPMTPVGHVLVFSFIQRFFPDFFPSPYTDRRQNLLKMYEAIEEKDIEQVEGGMVALKRQLKAFFPSNEKE